MPSVFSVVNFSSPIQNLLAQSIFINSPDDVSRLWAIDLALRDATAAGGRTVLPGDVPADAGQLKLLREISDHIRQEFSAEIDVIMQRQDERRL